MSRKTADHHYDSSPQINSRIFLLHYRGIESYHIPLPLPIYFSKPIELSNLHTLWSGCWLFKRERVSKVYEGTISTLHPTQTMLSTELKELS